MTAYDLHLGKTQFGDPSNAGRLMDMEEAHQMLKEWVPNEKLQLHMKQVAALMKAWSIEKDGADAKTAHAWELAGLLHDADWEKYPESHCKGEPDQNPLAADARLVGECLIDRRRRALQRGPGKLFQGRLHCRGWRNHRGAKIYQRRQGFQGPAHRDQECEHGCDLCSSGAGQ